MAVFTELCLEYVTKNHPNCITIEGDHYEALVSRYAGSTKKIKPSYVSTYCSDTFETLNTHTFY